jgi:hypothetical protein
MAAKTVLNLQLAVDDDAEHLARMLIEQPGPNARTMLSNLGKRITAYATGIKRSKFRLHIDESTDGSSQSILESARITATLTFANITAGETIVLGAIPLTWAVAAANENEVTIGADLAAAKANLIAAINAHSKLEGLFFAKASAVAAEVYIYFLGGSRVGTVMPISETGDALALSATTFDGDTTDVHVDSSDVLEVARDLGLYGS